MQQHAMFNVPISVGCLCSCCLVFAGQASASVTSSYSNSSSSTTISTSTHPPDDTDEEEESESHAAYALGVSALGTVGLLFFLVWLLHSKTPELRQGTWKMMHGTVSIFFGIVLYNALVDIYYAACEKIEMTDDKKMIVAGFWVFIWYCLFAAFLMLAVGFGKGREHRCEIALTRHRLDSAIDHTQQHENCCFEVFWTWSLMGPENKHGSVFNHRKRMMKAFLCLAHAMAFAGIDKWNFKQHEDGNKEHWYQLLRIVVIAFVSHCFFFLFLSTAFWNFALKFVESESSPQQHDGYFCLSSSESGNRCSQLASACWRKLWITHKHDGLIHEFEHIRIEGENDYMSLTLSFLVVQTLRFTISGGYLPDKAEDEKLFEHDRDDAAWLYLLSVIFLLLTLWVYKFKEGCETRVHNVHHGQQRGCVKESMAKAFSRLFDILIATLFMSAAWCFIYGSQWLLAKSSWCLSDPAVLIVMLAILLNFYFFSIAFLADWILYYFESKEWMRKQYLRFAKDRKGFFDFSSTTVGLVLGFTWEANFDFAMEHICESMKEGLNRELLKFFFVVLLVGLAFPVWTNHIIPMSETGFKIGAEIKTLKRNLTGMMDRKKSGVQGLRKQSDVLFLSDHRTELQDVQQLLNNLLSQSGSHVSS